MGNNLTVLYTTKALFIMLPAQYEIVLLGREV